MYINRKINILEILNKKSCFLLGPRQTGKSSLIKNELKGFKVFNLLDSEVFLNFSAHPSNLRKAIMAEDKIVIIDEIQKLPELLDEVHLLIEDKKINFLLTGSSARKLRKAGVNLLGGRARKRYLHPFIYHEVADQFELSKVLNYGLIPSIFYSDEPYDDLSSYVGDYIQQEIIAESLVKKIPAFSRFLEVSALCSGQIINYANISNDSQVPATTVQEYFQILRDTLIGSDLPVWKGSLKRKPISTSKFYFFDIGVVNFITKRKIINERNVDYGFAFEHYIYHELRAYADYNNLVDALFYWRSSSGHEVDFILNDILAVEIKSKSNITSKDLKGIRALMEEKKLKYYVVVSQVPFPLNEAGIEILPWKIFLDKLWAKHYI